MEKSILIYGLPSSGKTTKAKEIASQFKKNEVEFISYRGTRAHEDKFLFSNCTRNTKLIVFEEFYDFKQLESFTRLIWNPIVVNRMMKKPFTIEPKFIIVCDFQMKYRHFYKLGYSFIKKFDVIECVKELNF